MIIRATLLLLFVANSALLSLGANPAGIEERPFQGLGEQLANSIRNKDIVEYSQCWMSYRRLRAIVSAPGVSIPEEGKKELAKMKPYYEERNRHIAYSFKVLIETLSKAGDLRDLRLVEVKARIKEVGGIRQTSMFTVTVTLGKTRYEIEIDDGFEDSGSWFFSDKPLRLVNMKTAEGVSLLIPQRNG